MEKIIKVVRVAFALPWLVIGAQHFMYANFVAQLVPAFMPVRIFWAYFTGAAMIAAGISFIFNRKSALAAFLLGAMLTTFILLIHVPALLVKGFAVAAWTRPLQDLAIACAAFMLAGISAKPEIENRALNTTADLSRYIFAVLLIIFGTEQFLNLDFQTAKVADYLPLRMFWVYLTGAAMVVAGVCVLINWKARFAAFALGTLLLILNLLLHVYLLANAPQIPLVWTAAMLDLAITCGVFILASTLPKETEKSDIIL